MIVRPATSADVAPLVTLIDGVYREYGDRIFLEGADADLLDIDGYYRQPGGEFVVLDDAGSVRGAHAVLPFANRPGVCTFRRLYLDPALRGAGVGTMLMFWAIDWAVEHGLTRVEYWSDTRFARAHRFFERLGFVRTGELREMSDGADPYREYFFCGDLPSIAAQAER
jgi:putative acetyltransferase